MPNLDFSITNRCNLNCKHCHRSFKTPKQLGTDGVKTVLRNYVSFLSGRGFEEGSLSIGGGEPLLREDIFDILKFVSRQGALTSSLLTNGSLVDEECAAKLGRFGLSRVQVSLEGTEKVNDSIRGRGTFGKTLTAIKMLAANGLRVTVSCRVTRKNYADFFGLARLCQNLGVSMLWVDRVVPMGNAECLKSDLLSPEELKGFYTEVYALSKKLKLEGSAFEIAFNRSLCGLIDTRLYSCGCGVDSLHVLPNGDLTMCPQIPIRLGNVVEEDMLGLYYRSELLRTLRNGNVKSGKCVRCAYFERCKGGSLCMTYAYFKDLSKPDPHCWVHKR